MTSLFHNIVYPVLSSIRKQNHYDLDPFEILKIFKSVFFPCFYIISFYFSKLRVLYLYPISTSTLHHGVHKIISIIVIVLMINYKPISESRRFMNCSSIISFEISILRMDVFTSSNPRVSKYHSIHIISIIKFNWQLIFIQIVRYLVNQNILTFYSLVRIHFSVLSQFLHDFEI